MSKNTLKLFALFSIFTILVVSFKSMDGIKTSLRDSSTPLNKIYKINNLKKHTIVNQGVLEEITTKTYHSNLGYKIDFDVNLFKPKRTNGLDKFTFISEEEIGFTIEKIDEKEYKTRKNMHNRKYKKIDDSYLKIKIYCPEDPSFQYGIYNKIIYFIDNIESE